MKRPSRSPGRRAIRPTPRPPERDRGSWTASTTTPATPRSSRSCGRRPRGWPIARARSAAGRCRRCPSRAAERARTGRARLLSPPPRREVVQMSESNRRYLLRQRPSGRVDESTFDLVTEQVPEIGAGEALIRTEYISVDPTNRGWLNDTPTYLPPVQIGEVVRAAGLGRVVASNNPAYEEGQAVPGADRLAGMVRRLRYGAADSGRRDARGRVPERLPRRARDDRPDGLGRHPRDRQAEGGGDRRRLRRRRRGRIGRRTARQGIRRPRRRDRRRA